MFELNVNILQEIKRKPKASALYIERLHKEIRRLEEDVPDNTTDYINELHANMEDLEVEVATLEAEVGTLQEENRHLKLTVLKRNI